MRKQHTYEVTVVEQRTATVLVTAYSIGEARSKTQAAHDAGQLIFENSIIPADEWLVEDLGEDLGQ